MLDWGALSRIGFGAYRATIESAEHRQALLHALRSGCNLIDTSANYMNGQSEALIGQVTAEHPELETFVITKAGYIQGGNLAIIEELNQRGLAREGLVVLSKDAKYSIHPDFLRCQLKLSRRRLNRQKIDGFLLHNPEHYFEQDGGPASRDEYYTRIHKAFEFLEEMVAAGVIRYYGISSNTLPFSTDIPSTTDLHRVLAIAAAVSASHHFKLVEFPFNLIEADALKPHHGGISLIDLARGQGLVTLSNRPLNAKVGHGAIRLAAYDEAIRELDETKDAQIFADCLNLIRSQLQRVGSGDDPMDFTVVQFLRDSWMTIANPELVDQVFQQHFYPFLDSLYGGSPPAAEVASYAKLQRYAGLYSRSAVTKQAEPLRRELADRGLIWRGDPRPLAVIACGHGLEVGIDHVLVGMRRVEYVDSLRSLL